MWSVTSQINTDQYLDIIEQFTVSYYSLILFLGRSFLWQIHWFSPADVSGMVPIQWLGPGSRADFYCYSQQ